MTLHVNISEAKTRLSELVAAAVRGEDIVLDKAGVPQVKLVPVAEVEEARRKHIAAQRKAAFGMFRNQAQGYDHSLEALKAERGDSDERFADAG